MKKLLAALLVLTLLTGLCACGASRETSVTVISDSPEHPQDGQVVLNIVTSYGGDDGNRQNFEAAIADYEARTGNLVLDDSATSNEDWKAKVITDFETGSEPDVLFFFTNVDADPFILADKVVSIQEIRSVYPDYASNMKDSMLAVAADGKQYAVPSSGFWENLFVNRRVMEACGLEVPGPDYTWDEFIGDCRVIRSRGYTPIACSLFEVPHYWFEFCVMNNGSLHNHQEIPRSVDDPAGQKWVAALEDIEDLYHRGYFPSNTLTATDAETVAMFCDDEAAFLIDGSWKVGYFTEYHADSLDHYAVSYVPAKGERRATEAIGGISMGYFITRKAWDNPQKREAAVEFVELLTSDEILSQFVTTEVTALKQGARPAGLNALQQSAAQVNGQLTGVVGPVQDLINGEAKSVLFSNIQNVVTGVMPAREAVRIALELNQDHS